MLNNLVKGYKDNPWFILIVAIFGTVVLCLLNYWLWAMFFSIPAFMLFFAVKFNLLGSD